MSKQTVLLFCLAVAASALCAMAKDQSSDDNRSRPDTRPVRQTPPRGPQGAFLTDVPVHLLDIILGRPTATSVTLSVLCYDDAKAYVAYGTQKDDLAIRTEAMEFQKGEPREVLLDRLKPDTRYYYQLKSDATNEPFTGGENRGTFHTQRPAGSTFVFTVQADSHLDENTSPELYRRMLANVQADSPDFHIDLGDTFMTGKYPDRDSAAKQYLAQRYYFGLIGHSAPVFLVIGNHDGEEASKNGGCEADGLAVWSCKQRKRYFSNPVPDGFYTGNAEPQPYAGQIQDYYAWEWGDALFVVLDPYWYSLVNKGGSAPWNMTLGKSQYDWFARTLCASKAKYKFVFIHQLTGGLDQGGRGGAEAATRYEWGGHEKDGKDTFARNRPGWEKPIHNLLVENRVTIVFHGHDHFFARQELDGVIYQLVPQPSQRNCQSHHTAEYGYGKGEFYPSSGHIRVRVSHEQVDVDYVRAALGQNMHRYGVVNGQSSYSYTCGTHLDKNDKTPHVE